MMTPQAFGEPIERSKLLTPREIQVLRLLCEPCSTKEVAARLGISFKTAVSHRTHIMAKAGVHDPISLFRWGIRYGYIPPEVPAESGVVPLERYECLLCKRNLRKPKTVLVLLRCPKHGICWHLGVTKLHLGQRVVSASAR